MDQNTIVEALQKALTQGTGSLDDLENLLKRAQVDINTAKQEEKAKAEAAAKKRGQEIAELANRILEDKITDDDCAYVVNAWMRRRGIKDAKLTGKDLDEIFTNHDKVCNKITSDLNAALDDLVKNFADLADLAGFKPKANKKPETKKDPDDIINKFLKDYGL